MLIQLKKIFFIFTFNIFLFLFLMIVIQNNSSQKKINLIIGETIPLPISFILGISLISGSITGSLLTINFNEKEN